MPVEDVYGGRPTGWRHRKPKPEPKDWTPDYVTKWSPAVSRHARGAKRAKITILAATYDAPDWILGPGDLPPRPGSTAQMEASGTATIVRAWRTKEGFRVACQMDSGPHVECLLVADIAEQHLSDLISRVKVFDLNANALVGRGLEIRGKAWAPLPRHVAWLMPSAMRKVM